MTRNRLILLGAAGSVALLIGAFVFQSLGYAPCKLCVWQRWPHGLAVLAGVAGLLMTGVVWPLLGAAGAATSGAIGIYHTGVERGWWEGPNSCTSSEVGGLSPDQLMDQIMSAPLIRCDEVAWQFLSLSMASWNAILSFVLVAIWLMAVARPRP